MFFTRRYKHIYIYENKRVRRYMYIYAPGLLSGGAYMIGTTI